MGHDVIEALVARFSDHLSEYTSGQYNETQLRRDFLDPLFEALGWEKRRLAQAERSGDVPVPAFPVRR